MNATLLSLHSYPVKSARAQDHGSATLGPRGLLHDREWLVVDARGRFQTQRELPALARLQAEVGRSALRLRMDDAGIEVPFAAAGDIREVHIWHSTSLADDCGAAVAQWLSQRLGSELRLVRFNAQRPRPSDAGWTGGITALNAFSDGFPLLIASASSLSELNSHLREPLPMNRFRPNIVIDGLEPWAEDRIDTVQGDGFSLKLVKPCTRCVIPTTDQASGVRGSDEILRVLRERRYDAALRGVSFAWNAIVTAGAGQSLQAGQQLALSWKNPP